MKKTRITMTASLVILLAVAAMVVKGQFFSTVKDAYFQASSDHLRQVPADLVVVRPSHFPPSTQDRIRHIHAEDDVVRTVGHNVSFRDMMAEAYDCDLGQVVVPPGAPAGGFDFLVTTSAARKHLQAAIRKNLGYTAHIESRHVAVLNLKVINPSLPGLTVSPDSESDDTNYKNGTVYFTHQPLRVVLKGLEAALSVPVEDQTGLTNFYDFSLVWNQELQQKMKTGGLDEDHVNKFLNAWGLALEPDTKTMDMLIVEKAH
jgi:uncharacterized protein (TIGR03435 family)